MLGKVCIRTKWPITPELIPVSEVLFLFSSPQEVPDDQSIEDVVGRPVAHLAAAKQATGEAIYCDDIPKYAGNDVILQLASLKEPL